MSYLQLQLTTTQSQALLMEEVLIGLGALSIDMSDPKDSPIYEPPVATTPLWEEVQINALFAYECDTTSISAYITDEFNLLPTWVEIPDTNWQEECNKNFSLTQYGNALWVCPSWEDASHLNGVVIHLDPGMAFGTGAHETTHLCLEHLATHDINHKTVLDFGCGSGILAIAAAKLGASAVFAIDNDPQAITATHHNSTTNTCDLNIGRYEELSETAKFDIIIANILAPTLIELYPIISRRTVPNGEIILSGILTEQVTEVITCYEPLYKDIIVQTMGDWACIYAIRKH